MKPSAKAANISYFLMETGCKSPYWGAGPFKWLCWLACVTLSETDIYLDRYTQLFSCRKDRCLKICKALSLVESEFPELPNGSGRGEEHNNPNRTTAQN